MASGPQTTLIELGPITHVIPEDQEPTSLDPHDELLRWHYRLGHLPFDRIKQVALRGQLPKHLLARKKPFLFGVPVWQNDEKTMESQGRQQKRYENGHTAQANFFSGHIGTQLPSPHRPTQGHAYPTML